MNRILLLGGSGQIGYTLAQALATAGHPLRILIRNSVNSFPSSAQLQVEPSFSPEVFTKALQDNDVAVYALGLPAQWVRDQNIFQRVNVDLLEVFLRSLVQSRVRKLVYFSTFEIFQVRGGTYQEANELTQNQLSPYFESMRDAYNLVQKYAIEHELRVTCIHPVAVFGGLNTGGSFTNYLHNVIQRNYFKLPSILPGSFPLIHAESLAQGVQLILEKERWGETYMFSDGMTTLRDLAKVVKGYCPKAYRPLEIPISIARLGTAVLETVANYLTHKAPPLARVQIEYIEGGISLDCSKAKSELGWNPISIEEGVRRYWVSTQGNV